MACVQALVPDSKRKAAGSYWIADTEDERPSSPYEGDLCYCKDSKKVYVYAGDRWVKLG